jgi:hypothetical protein
MVSVAVGACDWFGLFFLSCLFLPFPDDGRRRHIVTFVTFPAQDFCFFVAGMLLPLSDDFCRLNIVSRMTLFAGRVNLTGRVHFIRRGGVVLIVFMSDGFAVAVGTGNIGFSVPLGQHFFCIICMTYKAGRVFDVCPGGIFFNLGRLI